MGRDFSDEWGLKDVSSLLRPVPKQWEDTNPMSQQNIIYLSLHALFFLCLLTSWMLHNQYQPYFYAVVKISVLYKEGSVPVPSPLSWRGSLTSGGTFQLRSSPLHKETQSTSAAGKFLLRWGPDHLPYHFPSFVSWIFWINVSLFSLSSI